LSVLFAFIVKPAFLTTYWRLLATDLSVFFLSSHIVFFVLSIAVLCIRKKKFIKIVIYFSIFQNHLIPEFISFCVICDIRKDRFGLFPILNFFYIFVKKVIALNSILMLASFGEGIAYAVFGESNEFCG
jgi:hypothetical protein